MPSLGFSRCSSAEISGRAVRRPRVQVAPGCGDGGVPKRRLDKVDWRAALETMARMGMAQLMRRHVGGQAGPRGGGLDDPVNLARVQRPPSLARGEHGLVDAGLAPHGLQEPPSGNRQDDNVIGTGALAQAQERFASGGSNRPGLLAAAQSR